MTDQFADLKPCRWCGQHPHFQRDDGLVSCFGETCPIGGEDFSIGEWNLLANLDFKNPAKLRNIIAAFHSDTHQHPRAKMFEKAFQILYTRLFPEVIDV